LLVIALLLVFGAAGVSGHLVSDDHCDLQGPEGSYGGEQVLWAPPGIQCVRRQPSGTDAQGEFVSERGWERSGRTGSWAGFVAALLAGFGIVGAALFRRSTISPWLRLTAVATLAFSAAGVLAIVGDGKIAVLAGVVVGVPIAFAADRWFLRGSGHRAETDGLGGATVVLCAAFVVAAAWLYGLGIAAYGLTLGLIAALAAAHSLLFDRHLRTER
jgi:hypothetical protein